MSIEITEFYAHSNPMGAQSFSCAAQARQHENMNIQDEVAQRGPRVIHYDFIST